MFLAFLLHIQSNFTTDVPPGGAGEFADPGDFPSLEVELSSLEIPVSDRNSSRSMNSRLKSLLSGLFQRLGPKNAEEESIFPGPTFPFTVPSENKTISGMKIAYLIKQKQCSFFSYAYFNFVSSIKGKS